MKKAGFLKASMVAVISLAFCIPVFSWTLGKKEMVLNGSGARTKSILTVYYASLYVPTELKGADAKTIIEADQPMCLVINIDSKLVSRDDFLEAVSEGFGKAAQSGYSASGSELDAYKAMYKDVTIQKGDKIANYYVPGSGMTVTYNDKGLPGAVKGLGFKKAFFAIYIGPNPAQEKLKKKLLGQ